MAFITGDEHRERVERCAQVLAREGLDCLIALPGSTFTYFTGLRFARERFRLLVAIIGFDGRVWLLGPTFEEDKLKSGPLEADVITWTDEDDQYGRVADTIWRPFGSRPKIGLEPTTNYFHFLGLGRAMRKAKIRECSAATDRLRAIKSEAEVACLREAARRTRERMERVPSRLEAGMTEVELARLFGPGAMVQFGPTTSMPNEGAGERKLEPGDPVVIDAGDRVEGYRSDLTRTFLYGEPSKRLREVYRVVDDAEQAAIEAARPGEPAEVVDLAARQVIERAGFGEYFTHRGGHGIGLDFHDLPICVAGNQEPLEPGMVITTEPGIYLPGEFGVRLEDDILVTDRGPEPISERGPLYRV
jgi:Xaa-Pro dipeptidase